MRVEWSGTSRDSMAIGADPGGRRLLPSPSPWVQPFLLDLAALDADPNRDIRVVIPAAVDLEPAGSRHA